MDLTGAAWHTSTRSQTDGQCVEVADNLPGIVAIRDSKDRQGPIITATPGRWRSFIAAVRVDVLGR